MCAPADQGVPYCPDQHWPDQMPTAYWHTFPAWDSPVSAVALKDGCIASSLTTSSPVYPLAPSTAMRWVFLVDPLEPAMLDLLGACRGTGTPLFLTDQGCLNRTQMAWAGTDWGNKFAFKWGPKSDARSTHPRSSHCWLCDRTHILTGAVDTAWHLKVLDFSRTDCCVLQGSGFSGPTLRFIARWLSRDILIDLCFRVCSLNEQAGRTVCS